MATEDDYFRNRKNGRFASGIHEVVDMRENAMRSSAIIQQGEFMRLLSLNLKRFLSQKAAREKLAVRVPRHHFLEPKAVLTVTLKAGMANLF